MWSDAGGGGFNTSFGGDEGTGFGTQQFASPGPEVKKGRRIDRVIPLTIRSVLDLDENSQKYYGVQLNMVVVVGLIREVVGSNNKIDYTLDDTTGSITVVKWHESELEGNALMENTYCRVFGTIKAYQGNKRLLGLHIEPITDFNYVTSHIIEVVHTVLQLQKLQNEGSDSAIGKGASFQGNITGMGGGGMIGGSEASGGMSNSLVGFGGVGVSSSGMGRGVGTLTKQQELVFDIVRAATTDTEDSGCSRDHVKTTLRGKITSQQVDDSLFYLSNEGHIYATMDEHHFKATVY